MSPAQQKQNGSGEPRQAWLHTESPPDHTIERHLRDLREAADDRSADTEAAPPIPARDGA